MKLFAPQGYCELTDKEREKICNGCGAAGSTIDLVPDTIWGLKISECCNIHDYMYNQGETLADKESADRAMLNNIIRFINNKTKWRWLRKLRRRRAKTYYWFVKNYGGPAYWDGKNKPTEETIVT